jgi:hypothetical protein
VATVRATRVQANITEQTAQGTFDFESVVEEVMAEDEDKLGVTETTQSIQKQIETVARDYQLQMQSYALALRELLPADIRVTSLRATLHFIDPNVEMALPSQLLDQEICARAIDDAMDTIASLDGTLDAAQFPPVPATHCRICNFRDLCPAGREWLRAVNEAPLSPSPSGRGLG